GGFQLLDLHDYLGQGTAFVGLLDAFWEPKSYIKTTGEVDQMKHFLNPNVRSRSTRCSSSCIQPCRWGALRNMCLQRPTRWRLTSKSQTMVLSQLRGRWLFGGLVLERVNGVRVRFRSERIFLSERLRWTSPSLVRQTQSW